MEKIIVGHDKDFVDQLTEASVEARAVLRDLYISMKEARKVLKEINQSIEKKIDLDVKTIVEQAMSKHLEALSISTQQAMRDSIEKVSREFDKLANIFITGSADGKPEDGFTLETFAQEYHAQRRGQKL
jgi:hypothetical protein